MENKQVVVSHSVNDMQAMAVAIARSQLFGIQNPDQALALMLIAQAEGLHPAVAARDYSIIKGRPALKADAMLARFQSTGGKVEWIDYTDSKVTGSFVHPASPKPVSVSWTIEQAKNAGLTTKDVWKQYPRAMLRARVISEGVRTCFPGVSAGIYTPEEIQDFDSKPAAKVVEAQVEQEKPQAQVVSIKPVDPVPAFAAITDSDKKALMKEIASGSWSKEQLREYCSTAFNKSSAEMTVPELQTLAGVVKNSSFENALNEVQVEFNSQGNFDETFHN